MSKIISFKKYLSKNNPVIGKLYFGDINHEIDQGFELSIKSLEKKISKAINKDITGIIWNNGLVKDASVEDIDKALKLIVANPGLDQLGPVKDQELDKPIVINNRNQPEGYLEEIDPDKSQRIAVTEQKIPKTTEDERFFALIDMLN